ncbi:MAG: M16 family metallopeptidase, partial [bacterium]
MADAISIVESSPDTPLVWFDIAIRGGAALDPRDIEGLHRHAALLARRGAGARDRAELDEVLD